MKIPQTRASLIQGVKLSATNGCGEKAHLPDLENDDLHGDILEMGYQAIINQLTSQ